MIKVKTVVTNKVPEWGYCNHMVGLTKVSKKTCRFCVSTGKGQCSCALYNMPLEVEQSYIANKCHQCIKDGHSKKAEIVDEDAPAVDPKDVMKATISEYRKAYKSLIAQGYPDVVADKLAQKVLLGGK